MFKVWGHKEEPAGKIEKELPLRKERNYSVQEAKRRQCFKKENNH